MADERGWDNGRKREEAVRYIRPSIQKASWGWFAGGRKLLDWLVRLGPPEETAALLRELLPNWSIGQYVPQYLSGLGEDGRAVLVKILEGGVDESAGLPDAAVVPSLNAGLTMADILRALARNDNPEAVGPALSQLIDYRSGPELRDALRNLRYDERSYLRSCLTERLMSDALSEFTNLLERNFGEPYYSSAGRYIMRGLLRAANIRSRMSYLQRIFGDSRLGFFPADPGQRDWLSRSHVMTRLLPRVQEMLGSLPHLDFGPLTGLALDGSPAFEYDDNLRFQYLADYGRAKGDTPFLYFIKDATAGEVDVERLVELERERDDYRDKVSLLRSELEAWRRETGWTGEKEVLDLGRQLEGEIRETEQFVNGERFDALRRASEELTPKLTSAEVTFERWEPEGLLGEYHPLDRTATIYTGMIHVLAASPAMHGAGSFDEVERALLDIAEIHEAVHGHLIHATTCDRESWQCYKDSSYRLHEALATAYTRRFIEGLQPDGVISRVLDALEPLLPAEYQAARLLADLSGEDLRSLLIAARDSLLSSALAETTRDVLRVVNSKAGVLAELLGKEAYEKLTWSVGDLSEKLQVAETPESPADACAELFSLFEEEVPSAISLVETLGGFDWPDENTLTLWRVAALCQGPPVGASSLRLRLDWIGEGPGFSAFAGYQDVKNTASLGLPGYEEALKEVSIAPDDPYFKLLQERQKSSGSQRQRRRREG